MHEFQIPHTSASPLRPLSQNIFQNQLVIEICSASNALEAHRQYEKYALVLKDWHIFIAGKSDSGSIKLLDLTLGLRQDALAAFEQRVSALLGKNDLIC